MFSESTQTPTVDAPKIAEKIGIKNLVIKREDLHPLGSHKGRSLPLMIQKGIEKGATRFVISSSGNAAKAAVLTIEEMQKKGQEISLEVFVGAHINPIKKAWLLGHASETITITESPRPLQSAIEAENAGAYSLRQSTDETAPLGYFSLGEELQTIPNLSDIFVPASSGTLAVGLGRFFLEKNPNVKIHVVQTEAVHPFSDSEIKSEHSIADAIVDKVGFRKAEILDIVSKSHGSVIVPSDTLISEAQNLLASESIEASPNGTLALAGLIAKKEVKYAGTVCILVCGK